MYHFLTTLGVPKYNNAMLPFYTWFTNMSFSMHKCTKVQQCTNAYLYLVYQGVFQFTQVYQSITMRHCLFTPGVPRRLLVRVVALLLKYPMRNEISFPARGQEIHLDGKQELFSLSLQCEIDGKLNYDLCTVSNFLNQLVKSKVMFEKSQFLENL